MRDIPKNMYSWVEKVDPNNIFIHPEYNFDRKENDIALIYLKNAPKSLPNVGSISLPTKYKFERFIGLNATTSGFGSLATQPGHLKYLTLPIEDNQQCVMDYKDIPGFNVNPLMHICLQGSTRFAVSYGDSGEDNYC